MRLSHSFGLCVIYPRWLNEVTPVYLSSKNQLSELRDAVNKSPLPTKACAVEQARCVSPFVRRQSL